MTAKKEERTNDVPKNESGRLDQDNPPLVLETPPKGKRTRCSGNCCRVLPCSEPAYMYAYDGEVLFWCKTCITGEKQ